MNNVSATRKQEWLQLRQNRLLVEYGGLDNQDNVKIIQSMLARCSFLIPRWLEKLNIDFYGEIEDGGKGKVDGACEADNWQYGYANISLEHSFWDRTEERRYEILIHELIHAAHGKVLSFDKKYLLGYMVEKNKDLFDNMSDRHSELIEEFVVNMTFSVLEAMNADRQ